MPDDEMEMAVDFGQTGFGEDIDIDLDFPAGQPDEDMDLGDFDRTHDIQNFNSDTRDELMAEGDDASYGMVDVIDLEHNASASVANDIDIELEQTVESIWQQEPQHAVDLQPDAEIDYIDEPTVEDMDAQRNNIETGEWMSVAPATQNIEIMDHAVGLSAEVLTGAQQTQEELPVDNPISFERTSLPPETLHITTESARSPRLSDERGNREPNEAFALEDQIAGVDAEGFAQSLTANQDEESTIQPDGSADANTAQIIELHELEEHPDAHHLDQVSEAGADHVEGSLALNGLDHQEGSGAGDVKHEQADSTQPEEAPESADDNSEYQFGGASNNDSTEDRTTAAGTVPQTGSSTLDGPGLEPAQVGNDQSLSDVDNQESVTADVGESVIEAGDRDDPFEIADRYGVYISYGQTDYRLFASSDDDDPNQYFLTDKMTLDLSLSRFLTSLREVISEEISPLDDLVMEIDGLGLEFSESTTSDFLDKFTFGDLMILYDKLVKNEQADSCPPIYGFLTVKPNCSRRMMALGESANAGRGLSEVGLYRDSSSLQDEQVDDADSPDTNFSTGEYDDAESGSIHQQEDFEENGEPTRDEHGNLSPAITEDQLERISDDEEQLEHISIHEDHEDHEEEHIEGVSGYDEDDDNDKFASENEETAVDAPADVVEHEHPIPINDQDDATGESLAVQSPEADEHSQQQEDPEIMETKPAKPFASKPTPMNPTADAPTSEHTSVTATLDGDNYDEGQDEIDYNSDEGEEEIDAGIEEIDEVDVQKQVSTPDLTGPVDDEITWESEDDEDKNATEGGSPKDMVQVSSLSTTRSPIKRSHEESGTLNGTDDKNDHKRRRP